MYVPLQRSSEGNLARTGDTHVAVNRLSAVYQSSERQFSIDKDHSNIVKFSRNDPVYDIVALWLNEIADSLNLLEINGSEYAESGVTTQIASFSCGQLQTC